jgi:predicted dienelactone hydrolase
MLEALPNVSDPVVTAAIEDDGKVPIVTDFRVLLAKWKADGYVTRPGRARSHPAARSHCYH